MTTFLSNTQGVSQGWLHSQTTLKGLAKNGYEPREYSYRTSQH